MVHMFTNEDRKLINISCFSICTYSSL